MPTSVLPFSSVTQASGTRLRSSRTCRLPHSYQRAYVRLKPVCASDPLARFRAAPAGTKGVLGQPWSRKQTMCIHNFKGGSPAARTEPPKSVSLPSSEQTLVAPAVVDTTVITPLPVDISVQPVGHTPTSAHVHDSWASTAQPGPDKATMLTSMATGTSLDGHEQAVALPPATASPPPGHRLSTVYERAAPPPPTPVALWSIDELDIPPPPAAAQPKTPAKPPVASHTTPRAVHPAARPVPKVPARPGLKWQPAMLAIALGAAVKVMLPLPPHLGPHASTLLGVFVTTVAGLVLEPLPVGAWSFCCLTALVASGGASFKVALSGITNDSIWLIVIAFFFAKSFEKTGLGERIANIFVAAVGQSTLGLAYGLAFAEALVAPALPSSTARAGGIFLPVIKFLSKSADSEPDFQRTKLGAFLVHCQCQASCQVAALFVTGAAQNILAMNIANQMGVVVPDVWVTWFVGAVVPAVVGLLMIPAMLFKLQPPDMKDTPGAPAIARIQLRQMGPPSRNEIITLLTLAVSVTIWVMGEQLKMPPVVGAMVGLASLLATGVLTWKDCLEYSTAWDTLLWFSVLMGMCGALAQDGLVAAFADYAKEILVSMSLDWKAAFAALHITYFSIHYIFASQVGHVGALYGAFLAMMLAAGVPSVLAAITLGYNANLFGSITHYASGPAAVYYSSGYQAMQEVLPFGALMGLRSLLTWGVVGMVWWKFLGWY